MNTNNCGHFKSFLCVICALCVFALLPVAQAQLKITASITVTNLTTNGMVFTYNGDTRTFTNNVFNSATQVLTNSDVTGCGSKTNLLTQIRSTSFSKTFTVDTGSNSFNVIGNADLPVALTVSPGYASVSYSTQLVTDMVLAQVPVSGLQTAQARTNVASGIAGALNSVENTNPVHQVSLAASELMGLTNGQTISGVKVFTNALGQWFGVINSPAISGTVILLSGGLLSGCTITQAPSISGNVGVLNGGVYTNGMLISPVMTNGVNYGNAFSSPGTGDGSEQFGAGANASGENAEALGADANANGIGSLSVGQSALASAEASTAIGSGASATNTSATALGANTFVSKASGVAVGDSAIVRGTSGTAIGQFSDVEAPGATAIGANANASFTNSTAIGKGATTTAAGQVMLGAPGISTVVQNNLTVQTNLAVGGSAVISGNFSPQGLTTNQTWTGTNNFLANADIAFTRKAVSSLANGGNAAVPVGTNVFFEVSGPTGAFSIDGIANGRDGKMIILLNQTAQQMTIKNLSGTDPTAANRIRTLGSATDLVLTNAACTFIYSGAVTNWILISHNP